MNFRLPKSSKLRHRTLVNRLFEDGTSLYAYPLRMIYRKFTDEELATSFRNKVPNDIDAVQFMITIPKKKQRRAVDRVLLRRRIRESYRLNRHHLHTNPTHRISIGFLYLSDRIYDSSAINERMNALLSKLERVLSKNTIDTDSQP